jgi:fructose-1,6-bisphosphatase/inositol monophosphatase family enzyme
MILSSEDLQSLAILACKAAKSAGEFIADFPRELIEARIKEEGGSSPASQIVTEADLGSQEIILDIIEPSCIEFDLALLTEEHPDDSSRFEKEYFWCIDPLDGTQLFAEDRPGYAVCISLVSREGNALIGVIYDPIEDRLYHAISSQGAFLNGEALRISQETNPRLTFNCDRSFFSYPKYEHITSDMKALAEDVQFRQRGGAAMNAIDLIHSAPAVYFKYPVNGDRGGSLWDYAASSCILAAAGGYAADFHGNPLDLNRKDSRFMGHQGIFFASDPALARIVKEKLCPRFS